VVAKALQAGVVLISAGTNIIRFVPPLIVEKEHIDKMINVLDDVLSE
jgi:acetylornithine/N-succinyldiaminopimelate aminotransferase